MSRHIGITGASAVRRTGGALLIGTGALALAPLFILGPAIGWPDSLGEPAAVQLAAVAAKGDAVRFGYAVYLLYSLMILPATAVLARYALPGGEDGQRALLAAAISLAAASALARCIGILRWLTVMPLLAEEHAVADTQDRESIELLFEAINEYGGGIGELLGVSVFMAMAMLLIVLPAWRRRSLPRWLIVWGAVAALALAALLMPALGLGEWVPIAVAATLISLWQIAAGVWLLTARSAPEAGAPEGTAAARSRV